MAYLFFIFLSLCFSFSVSGRDFVSNPESDKALDSWFTEQVGITSDKQGKCFYLKRPEGAVMPGERATTKMMIEVTPGRKYEFSGYFKLSTPDKGKVAFGYLAFDKNKKRIRIKERKPYYRKLCSSFIVCPSPKEKAPLKWTRYSGTTTLEKGTKYIVPYIYYTSKKFRKCKLYFKNIKVKAL